MKVQGGCLSWTPTETQVHLTLQAELVYTIHIFKILDKIVSCTSLLFLICFVFKESDQSENGVLMPYIFWNSTSPHFPVFINFKRLAVVNWRGTFISSRSPDQYRYDQPCQWHNALGNLPLFPALESSEADNDGLMMRAVKSRMDSFQLYLLITAMVLSKFESGLKSS